jgi:hypothetical protein
VPCLLAAGYLALLVVRFPHLIGWWNADSDIATAYTITDAVSLGHTGQVLMSTQGSWVPLWYGLLTHGLSFHRVLWEISPALLTLATACLIGWSVARVASRTAGALTVALIVAASPVGLRVLTAAYTHNTTVAGVAILGAYLVWLSSRLRTHGRLIISILVVSLVVGTFLASDQLLGIVGLFPFLVVPLVLAARRRDVSGLVPVLAATLGSVVVSLVTSGIMRSLDFVTTPPSAGLTRTLIGTHIKWLIQGLLRMGNGLNLAPQAPIRAPLTVGTGVVTVCALGGMFWLAGRSVARPTVGDLGRARDLHATFWAASLLCVAVAYVVTNVAVIPSDRYFIIAVPAVAATVPLLLTSRRASRFMAAAATVFIVASTVALAANDERGANSPVVAQAPRIEAIVSTLHLGVGYAGWWEAASLAWATHERLRIYPVTDLRGPVQPTDVTRVVAWYRPRPHTPSYLLLASGDETLPNRLPRGLPTPEREVRIGQITMAVYPYDIASYIH